MRRRSRCADASAEGERGRGKGDARGVQIVKSASRVWLRVRSVLRHALHGWKASSVRRDTLRASAPFRRRPRCGRGMARHEEGSAQSRTGRLGSHAESYAQDRHLAVSRGSRGSLPLRRGARLPLAQSKGPCAPTKGAKMSGIPCCEGGPSSLGPPGQSRGGTWKTASKRSGLTRTS